MINISDYLLQFMEVTRNAAIASFEFVGKRDNHEADRVAVEAMRQALNKMTILGEVVIGEGERDEAPMLYIGEKVGAGGIVVDIAVDPLEGTNLCAKNLPGSICVMAIGETGSLFRAPDTYMDKIVVGSEVSDEISLNNSLKENLEIISDSYKLRISEINIIVLDRERHIDLIADLREMGVHVHLITDADINAGISAALPNTKIHALMGIGAAPEGVIKAVAVKGLKGKMRAKFKPQNDEVVKRMQSMGIKDFDKEYTQDDLAKGENLIFVATGVTSGDLIRGIKVDDKEIHSDSLLINCKTHEVIRMQNVQIK
jgi:fructose-1,6-bisphosphatase II